MSAQAPIPAAAQKALEGLADIATPLPVSWMPQTWGWTALAIALSVTLIVAAWRWRRHALANRYRAEALSALSALEAQALNTHTRADALVHIAELIKRTALAAYARTDVARLSGPAWVQFIRDSGVHGADDASTLLNDIEYRSRASLSAMSDADAKAVVRAARTWIEGHRVPA